MKHSFEHLFSILCVFFVLVFVSCGKLPNPVPDLDIGLGDAQGGDGPGDANSGDDPGDGQSPRDPSNNYGGGGAQSFDFGGSYQGACSVSAYGISAPSCVSKMTVYHEEGSDKFGFYGTLEVDMITSSSVWPIGSAPMDIKDGKLLDPGTGEVYGGIDHTGFLVVHENGDWMRFDARDGGGFHYQGEHNHDSYGLVLVEGNLEKLSAD